MTFPLSQYVFVKNRYCISYFGNDKTVVDFILQARNRIENAYDLQIYILVKDKLKPVGKKNIITESGMAHFTKKLACVREVTNINEVKNLLGESEI